MKMQLKRPRQLKRLIVVFLLTAGVAAFMFIPKELKRPTDHAETFEIEMRVDFGPATRPVHQSTLEVEKGTTAKDAVSQIFPIRSGKSCCSLREVIEIDGIGIDPAKSFWWTCSVNGSRKFVTPHHTKLNRGDIVEWKYVQSAQ